MKQTAHFFKALSDETRLRILSLLLVEGELCVCDIIAALGQPQSTVSRHLAYLKKTGWVNDRRCGLWMYYSVAEGRDDMQKNLSGFLRSYLQSLPGSADDRESLAAFGNDSRCA